MSRLNAILALIFVVLCYAIWAIRHKAPPTVVQLPQQTIEQPQEVIEAAPQPEMQEPAPVPEPKQPPLEKPKKQKLALPYVIDDGIAVVQGDVAIGKPIGDNIPETGIAAVPSLQKWPSRTIAYYIQPTVVDPERVKIALAMFDQSAIRFVPHTNQQDALVFEDARGICKSYVGHIGGLQPVWIPAGCGPREIAHEVLHALGFVHEQNRSDRDDFISVLFDNIDEKYRDNFEKLPQEYMAVSGLAPFDFESLMIYPVWMFVKHGQATMESKVKDHSIQPSDHLSTIDLERLNLAYGNLPN